MKAKKASTPKQPTPQEVQKREEEAARQRVHKAVAALRRIEERGMSEEEKARQRKAEDSKRRKEEEFQKQTASLAPFPYVLEQPLRRREVSPDRPPKITTREIIDCLNARNTYGLARADFEQKKATLVKKLLLYCEPEKQEDYSVYLDQDGKLVLVDRSSIFRNERTYTAEEKTRC